MLSWISDVRVTDVTMQRRFSGATASVVIADFEIFRLIPQTKRARRQGGLKDASIAMTNILRERGSTSQRTVRCIDYDLAAGQVTGLAPSRVRHRDATPQQADSAGGEGPTCDRHHHPSTPTITARHQQTAKTPI
jgi:hypothetical protein